MVRSLCGIFAARHLDAPWSRSIDRSERGQATRTRKVLPSARSGPSLRPRRHVRRVAEHSPAI